MIHLQQKLAELEPKAGNTIFIAVDGHGGSGKSTLAKLLSEMLEAELIHTDDFAGWNNPIDWWPDVIEKVFKPIVNGEQTLSYQPASWWEDHHPEAVLNQPVTPIMILEGVSASRTEFNDFISLRFFVATPKEICLQRGIARDSSAGKSEAELLRIWENWFKEEDKYFEKDNPRDKADFIVDGTKPFEEQVSL